MMSSTTEEDPFLQVQADVVNTLHTTRPLFASYLRIRTLAPPSAIPTPELISAHSDLLSSLQMLEDCLSDLHASVQAIESDPTHFFLPSAETTRRRRLVEDITAECADMREEISRHSQDAQNRNKGKAKESEAKSRSMESLNENAVRRGETIYRDGLSDSESGDDVHPDYDSKFQQQQQVRMLREQDGVLEEVAVTVGNLRTQAGEMGRELEEQAEMLEGVEGVVDRVGGRLKGGLKSMGNVVRRGEDRWSGVCVWLLIGLLVLLLVLVVIL